MVACRYGISLVVFNSTSHSLAHLWAIELNTRREIPYLRAPIYYSLFILIDLLTPSKVFGLLRFYPTLKVSQRFSVAAYNNKACAPSLNQTRRSDHTSIIVQTKIPSCQRKQTALSKKSPHYSFLCPVEIRTNFSSQKLLLIADGFSEHNRLEISVLESKCGEHNNDDFSSTVECYESYESAENWLVGFAVILFAVIDSQSTGMANSFCISGWEYMKVIYLNCGLRRRYESDLRSYEHYLSSSKKKARKKFRPVRDLNPWPLWYRCSALPTELTSQLGAGYCVGSK